MFAHHRNRVRVLAATADAVWTVLSFEIAYRLRTGMQLSHIFFLPLRAHVIMVLFCAGVWVALASRQRLYDRLGDSPRYVISQTLQQCLLGITLLVILQYVMNIGQELSRSFLALFFLLNFLGMVILRRATPLLMGAYQRRFGQTYHLVLVGNPERVDRLATQLREGTPYRIDVAATLDPREAFSTIPQLLRTGVVDEVVFAVDSEMLATLEPVFLHCDEEGVRTRVAVDFFPHVNSQITLQRVGSLPLLTFSAAPLEQASLFAKRAIDIVVSMVALIVLIPVFAVIALAVKLTSEGPVIFSQVRAGLNGRLFTMYKYRSMVQDAEALRSDLEHLNERQIAFKLHRDPRVTPLGYFLRRFSLDELPQFYNILRGDMSLVGPRPPLPEEVAQYQRWQKRRLRMRPGLTCLWAIMGRDAMDFESWMRADLSYIDNWSLSLDWVILLRSIPFVLGGRDAH